MRLKFQGVTHIYLRPVIAKERTVVSLRRLRNILAKHWPSISVGLQWLHLGRSSLNYPHCDRFCITSRISRFEHVVGKQWMNADKLFDFRASVSSPKRNKSIVGKRIRPRFYQTMWKWREVTGKLWYAERWQSYGVNAWGCLGKSSTICKDVRSSWSGKWVIKQKKVNQMQDDGGIAVLVRRGPMDRSIRCKEGIFDIELPPAPNSSSDSLTKSDTTGGGRRKLLTGIPEGNSR